MLLPIAAAVLGFWALLSLDWRRRWPTRWRLERDRGFVAPGMVAAVIPARDEAEVLPGTLGALLDQGGALARIFVVDDHSTDGTREAIEEVVARRGAADRVRVIGASERPAGWTGKLHALETGCRALRAEAEAGGAVPEWILLTDADILHPCGSVAALLGKALRERLDAVSIMVRLRASAPWEKLLIPAFVYFFQLLYPFRRIADPRSGVAALAGGCILVRRAALEAVGGLEAMRSALIDDVALGALLKGSGRRIWLGWEPEMTSARGYDDLGGIIHMVSRTAFYQLRFLWSLLAGTLLFLGLFIVSPPLLALLSAATAQPAALGCALAAWGLSAGSYLPAVRHQRAPLWVALTLPLAGALYGWMTALSAARHASGAGVQWKGRQVA